MTRRVSSLKPKPWVFRRLPVYIGLLLATLFSFWPIMIMFFEGASIDLGPLWSGKGISFVSGVPYYSGGFFPSWANFRDALALGEFPRLVFNSTTIAMLSIAIALAAGIPAGYALARSKLRGMGAMGFLLLALRTVSPFAIVLPLYLTYVQVGLFDSYLGMSLAYLVIDVPVVVWMLSGFFREVPERIYEAAESSGASERQIFWKVAVPSVVVGIAATAIFAFVLIWNEFLMASLLTGAVTKTVSVGVWSGVGEGFGGLRSANWDAINAAGALAFVPAFALILVVRQYLAKGFSLATAS
ncbi:MAG TPA: carbohydrate ABC transporter permease [Nitrososphaerales archaeon]|nr:carbohydrate ABC transporter permease [Nitrososphaerales archaeon]